MRVPSWLRRRTQKKFASPTPSRRFRPGFDLLEDRVTPATLHWVGSGADVYWGNAANWDLQQKPQNGDTVVFDSGAVLTTPGASTNNLAGLTLASIHFTGSAGGFSINGQPVTLTGGVLADNTAGTNDVNLKLTLSGNQAVEADAGATLDINFPVTTGTAVLTLTGGGNIVEANSITGTGGVVVDGTGTYTFTTSYLKNYGTTTVNAGTLVLDGNGPNTIYGPLVIGDGAGGPATVRLALPNQIRDTAAITFNSDGTLDLNGLNESLGGLVFNGGQVTMLTGKLTLLGNVTVSGPGTTTITGGTLALGKPTTTFSVAGGAELDINATITNPVGSIIKAGAGTLKLQGTASNTFAATTVSLGTLELAKSAGKDAVTAGGLTINAGTTVQLDDDNQINDLAPVKILGGTLDLNDNAETIASPSTPLTLGASSQITLGTGTLTLKGNVNATGPVSITAASGGAVVLPVTVTVNVSSGTLTLNTAITGSGGLTKSGAGTLALTGTDANTYTGATKASQGTLLLNKTAVDAVVGPLVVGDGAGGPGADLVKLLQPDQIANNAAATLTVTQSGKLDLFGQDEEIDGAVLLSGGSIVNSDINPLDVSHLTLAPGADVTQTQSSKIGDGTGLISLDLGTSHVFNTAVGTLTINAPITDGGSNYNVTKTGEGTLEFAGSQANTYGGTTTVNAGTLYLNKATAGTDAITSGPLVIGDGLGFDTVKLGQNEQINDAVDVTLKSSGQLVLNGKTETIGGTLTLQGGTVVVGGGNLKVAADVVDTVSATIATTGSGVVTLTAGIHTVTVAPSQTLTLNAPVTGASGNVVKGGTGTLLLTGQTANSYGTMTVNQGILSLAKKPGTAAVPGTLIFGQTVDATEVRLLLDEQIADTAAVTVGSTGTLNINGRVETLGGLLTLSAGTVATGLGKLTVKGGITSSGASTITGNLLLGTPAQMITVAADTLTISALIGGSGAGLTKAGAGELLLTANNVYTGPTVASAGTLTINGDQRLSPLTVAGGTVQGTGKVGTLTGTTSGGTIIPGLVTSAASAIQVVGTATFNGAPTPTTVQIRLGTPTGYNRLNSTGTMTLNSVAIDLDVTGGFSAPAGTVFTILHSDTAVLGTAKFNGVTVGNGGSFTVSGQTFKVAYTGKDVNLVLQ